MSLSKRLLNLARAEISDAFKKLKSEPPLPDPLLDDFEDESFRRHRSHTDDALTSEISEAYGNLELPIGASKEEVRAAYRRLIRRYHPDQHHQDEEKRKMATEVSAQLRVSYEKLMAHLG